MNLKTNPAILPAWSGLRFVRLLMVGFVLPLVLLSSNAHSQTIRSTQGPQRFDLPSVESVISQHIDALGGRAVLESINTVTIQSRLTTQSTTQTNTIDTILRQSGNRIKMEMLISSKPIPRTPNSSNRQQPAATPIGSSEPVGISMGSNGETPWAIQPGPALSGGGPRLLQGQEKSEFAQQFSQPFPPLEWKNYDGKISVVGAEMIEGKKCFRLLFEPKIGSRLARLFDAKTGLIVRLESTERTPDGVRTVHIVPSDYQKIEGVTVPMKQTSKMDDKTLHVMETLAVRFNTTFAQNTFDLPDEIQALVDARANPQVQPSTAPTAPPTKNTDR